MTTPADPGRAQLHHAPPSGGSVQVAHSRTKPSGATRVDQTITKPPAVPCTNTLCADAGHPHTFYPDRLTVSTTPYPAYQDMSPFTSAVVSLHCAATALADAHCAYWDTVCGDLGTAPAWVREAAAPHLPPEVPFTG